MRQSDGLTIDQCCITFHEYSWLALCSPWKWTWSWQWALRGLKSATPRWGHEDNSRASLFCTRGLRSWIVHQRQSLDLHRRGVYYAALKDKCWNPHFIHCTAVRRDPDLLTSTLWQSKSRCIVSDRLLRSVFVHTCMCLVNSNVCVSFSVWLCKNSSVRVCVSAAQFDSHKCVLSVCFRSPRPVC